MANQLIMERAVDLGKFAEAKSRAGTSPFSPVRLAHIYIKLDFKSKFECAQSADDARRFLRSVARSALGAQRIADQYGGVLLEVQGSTLHVGLPADPNGGSYAAQFAGDIHAVFRAVFDDPSSRVEGWRLTADAGKTLVVAGRGVHGDDSWVSLGTAANRPAKHLYAQLELPEASRHLKRFHLGSYDTGTRGWTYKNLDPVAPSRAQAVEVIANEARSFDPTLDFSESSFRSKTITARAVPIAPPHAPGAPTADKPHTYFGWVMRVDLDGFTARVEDCINDDPKLQSLAAEFYGIMDAAALFVDTHKESLVQLPWAGDNFTAASVFGTKPEYDGAAPRRLVELSLDFEKEMCESAINCGFGGWAHGVAGGLVHGNSGGNVYLGAVVVGNRRFLVGAGEGFGRSAQAFGDINPKAKDLVLYEPDWQRLDVSYKAVFEPAVTYRGSQSSLYRKASMDGLVRARSKHATTSSTTTVSVAAARTVQVATRPHYR